MHARLLQIAVLGEYRLGLDASRHNVHVLYCIPGSPTCVRFELKRPEVTMYIQLTLTFFFFFLFFFSFFKMTLFVVKPFAIKRRYALDDLNRQSFLEKKKKKKVASLYLLPFQLCCV